MTPRSHGLDRVISELGTSVLVPTTAVPDRVVRAVCIHDPLDDTPVPPDSVVLGVGVAGEEPVVDLLARIGTAGAAALVVKAPAPGGERIRAAVVRTGVALLELTRAASWSQVAALLRARLAEDDATGTEPPDDLFALANAVAALLDAPVTIEDRAFRVLAYSGRQEEADPGRIATVLGRQVPAEYQRTLLDRGVFTRLYASHTPIHVDPVADGALPRAAMAVRAGDDILGSMWAAVREPLSAGQSVAFADAAKVVALHLMRRRAGGDVAGRLRADLLATMLEGGPSAGGAASQLGLVAEPLTVIAAEPAVADPVEPARRLDDAERLAAALGLHLTALHPHAATALLGHTVYAVLPGERDAVAVAEDFVSRTGARSPVRIGVGRRVGRLAEAAVSRADADRTLRVLRTRDLARAARYSDVFAASALLRLADIAASQQEEPSGAYALLLAYDAVHKGHLVATLRAFLDSFGDVNRAAAAVHVHPNTFRYRLRRVTDVGRVDLTDPEARFGLDLQIRLFPPGSHDA
ncbi:helix-turn-helix domain-containing protein [Longispora sp. K20-0274]|uniref:PucR family transcriptional regulator n=1 Tax=Longispora sp. K20-0274 TaxID=3088255 RepID=UPI00399A12AD